MVPVIFSTGQEDGLSVPIWVERAVWASMVRRCVNPGNPGFKHYGGRGIRVCDRWLFSFENFIDDMGRRPAPGYTLDRIDNDGPYSPENCRWATQKEQARNRRSNVMIEHKGERLCSAQWAARAGIHRNTLRMRLKAGWSIEKALSTPVPRTKRTKS